MTPQIQFDPAHFKEVIRAILRSGEIRIPAHIQKELDKMGPAARRNPYNGHCAQTTAAAWVLGKELYGEQFAYKAYHSPDNWHYWLAKEVAPASKENALDLTDHETDANFPYGDREPARWITKKRSRADLAGMKRLKDAVKLYDLARAELLR